MLVAPIFKTQVLRLIQSISGKRFQTRHKVLRFVTVECSNADRGIFLFFRNMQPSIKQSRASASSLNGS